MTTLFGLVFSFALFCGGLALFRWEIISSFLATLDFIKAPNTQLLMSLGEANFVALVIQKGGGEELILYLH